MVTSHMHRIAYNTGTTHQRRHPHVQLHSMQSPRPKSAAPMTAPADLEQLREVGRRGCACARANKAHISRVDAREGEGWSCARHCHFAPHAAAVLAREAASQQPRPECARKHEGVRTSSFAGRGTSCRWASTSVSKSRHGGRPARQQSSQALRSSARLCA